MIRFEFFQRFTELFFLFLEFFFVIGINCTLRGGSIDVPKELPNGSTIESTTPTEIPILSSTATPIPGGGSVPPKVVAAEKHLAPKGVYFLLTYISVTTDSGVTGIPPGSKVTLVSSGPPIRVINGQIVFEVLPAQITNDLDLANQIKDLDRAAQSRINQVCPVIDHEYGSPQPDVVQPQEPQANSQIQQNLESQRQDRIKEIRAEIAELSKRIRPPHGLSNAPTKIIHSPKKERRIRELQAELSRLGFVGAAFE